MTKILFTNSNYNFPNVLRNALDELIIDCHRSSPVAPAPDHFSLFTKGDNKPELLEDALTDTPLLLPLEYSNLETKLLALRSSYRSHTI